MLKKETPLHGKYLVQNKLARFSLQVFDLFFSPFFCFRKKNFSIAAPRKIVISNLAHLGDVILMTSILPIVKQNFPEVKIGVVVGSWSKHLVENHPLIDFVYFVDHWKLSREKSSIWEKYKTYRKTFKIAQNEIKKIKYDVAIVGNYHFPNAIPLFYFAKIPIRVGYVSGGFGFLLTHPHFWELKKQSAASYMLDLLKKLFSKTIEQVKPTPAYFSGSHRNKESYVIVHMGTGNAIKEWPISSWLKLCKKLDQERYKLIFTGKGSKEQKMAEWVHSKLNLSENLVNKLNWDQYLSYMENASLLLSVDTVAGHVASYFETPSVLIYTGINITEHWKPLNPKAVILSKKIPCSPCFRSKGCMSMKCIRGVSWIEVYKETQRTLKRSSTVLLEESVKIP